MYRLIIRLFRYVLSADLYVMYLLRLLTMRQRNIMDTALGTRDTWAEILILGGPLFYHTVEGGEGIYGGRNRRAIKLLPSRYGNIGFLCITSDFFFPKQNTYMHALEGFSQ